MLDGTRPQTKLVRTYGGRSNNGGSSFALDGSRTSGFVIPDVITIGSSIFSELPIPGKGTLTVSVYCTRD